jgi:hypothetical protein
VVLQIEAAVQHASSASEEKASKMEDYAAQGRGIGRKVGLDWSIVVCIWSIVVCVWSIVLCVVQLFLHALVSQASNRRSSLVMHLARATSQARRDSLTGVGGMDDEDGDEEDGNE